MNKIFDKLAKGIKNHVPDMKAFESRFKPEPPKMQNGKLVGKIII